MVFQIGVKISQAAQISKYWRYLRQQQWEEHLVRQRQNKEKLQDLYFSRNTWAEKKKIVLNFGK